ncbi:glutamate receptor ionotropic, NMDA 2B-like [Haliotis rufescens]|uniref:glutamate receptor ionotropic, NMDA 2B-like n=1 Tax=Haliotis rufescens TaxID=6454 RepID=UPI00201E7672|nr:glutamate receptor ionotropic, NMDA 2B-like [Haliotis rufescens]XP_046372596.2 glutamate receptor ionotropic, NMDA 2B-like [Haliotis rufescens]
MDTYGLFTLLVFLICVLGSGTWGRVRITLPVIVHLRWDRYHYSRHLPGGRTMPSRDTTLRRFFYLQGQLILLKEGDPKHILDAFCDTIFQLEAPVVLYINNPYHHNANPAATHYFRSITQYLGLPVITWDPEYHVTSQTHTTTRNLVISPTIHHQVKAMLSMLGRYNWTDIAIVTTNETGHTDFISAVNDLTRVSKSADPYDDINHPKPRFRILETLILRNVRNEVKFCQEMQRLIEVDSRIMLLYSRRSQTYVVMECARKLKITGSEYVWILSMDSVPKNSKTWVNPTKLPYGLFGVWYDYGRRAMTEAIDTSVEIWKNALKMIAQDTERGGSVNLQTPNFTCSSNNTGFWTGGAHMYEKLRSVSMINKGGQEIDFNAAGQLMHPKLKIINIQRNSLKGGKNWTVVGQWTREGLSMRRITWPGEALGPPKGKPKRRFLRIATLRENPYVIYQEMPQGGVCGPHTVACEVYPRDKETFKRLSNETDTKCCTGLSIDLLFELSAELEFDYELFEVYDGQWGAEVNKEWNGLVRVLLDKKADMVITSLKINPERSTAVDFSVPFLKTGITIIVSIRDGAISPTALLEPYDYPSWCFILLFSVHATGASIFIFEWLSPYGLDRGSALSKDHKFSLFRSLWLIWAMLFSAAVTTDTPRGISSRFLGNMWALFALVFLASYTANLAAFMITKKEYYDLSGIQDWRLQNPKAMKPPFKFGTIPNGSTETNIKSNDPEMYKYMRRYNRPSVAEGIKAVTRQQLHAFIYDATVLEYLAGQDKKCSLITVGKWGAMTGYGVAFPRGSPWIDKVNGVILRLTQKGEMERLQKFWLSGACHNNKKKDPNSNGFGQGAKSSYLGIRNFTSAFIFLAGGIALGVILVVLEHLYFRFGRNRLKQWDKRGCCALVSLSMGRSLTFKQYVTKAIDVHKRHRCTDRTCQAQFWEVQHELDAALGKVDKLQTLITHIKQQKEDRCVWRFESEGHPNLSPAKTTTPLRENAEERHVEGACEQPRRRQDDADKKGSDVSQVEKVRDELMKLLQDECERESVI